MQRITMNRLTAHEVSTYRKSTCLMIIARMRGRIIDPAISASGIR
jgi:hypothetical protein